MAYYIAKYKNGKFIDLVKGPFVKKTDATDAMLKLECNNARMDISYKFHNDKD